MNAKEKRKFITDLIASVKRDLIADIPKLPKEWDGIELRELIANRFADQKHSSMLCGKRKSDYLNEVIVRNL